MGQPQSSLRVEELEQRSLPNATPTAAVVTLVNEVRSDVLHLQHAVDSLKAYTDTVITNFVNDVKAGQDTTNDLQQLQVLTHPIGSGIASVFWDLRSKASASPALENDVNVAQRWGIQLETFVTQEVNAVQQDLINKTDPTKDLYLIETAVNYFDQRFDQGVTQFLSVLDHYG
jgi:hypothetical protein